MRPFSRCVFALAGALAIMATTLTATACSADTGPDTGALEQRITQQPIDMAQHQLVITSNEAPCNCKVGAIENQASHSPLLLNAQSVLSDHQAEAAAGISARPARVAPPRAVYASFGPFSETQQCCGDGPGGWHSPMSRMLLYLTMCTAIALFVLWRWRVSHRPHHARH